MRKLFSIVFFILVLAVFAFELYFGIVGAIEVNNQFAELAARGASGHEYLGVGLDIVVIGVLFLSVFGSVISFCSYKIAQHRMLRLASAVMCPLFFVPIFICAIILEVG